jgi:hypothetical protein
MNDDTTHNKMDGKEIWETARNMIKSTNGIIKRQRVRDDVRKT